MRLRQCRRPQQQDLGLHKIKYDRKSIFKSAVLGPRIFQQ